MLNEISCSRLSVYHFYKAKIEQKSTVSQVHSCTHEAAYKTPSTVADTLTSETLHGL